MGRCDTWGINISTVSHIQVQIKNGVISMASKAKKLPSGNYRSVVSYKGADGVRHQASFTAQTKREAECMAADFEKEKERLSDCRAWTLGEAIDRYIDLKRSVLSQTTIHDYERIRRMCFQSIMDLPLKRINGFVLSQAVLEEQKRSTPHGNTRSPKSVRNAYGLVSATLHKFMPNATYSVDMPRTARQIRTLPHPVDIYNAVRGSDIELACLLAMWLSFSQSEVRGLTKSKSIDGDYITIREVLVRVGGEDIRKPLAKTDTRLRRHHLPPYIKELIGQVDGDIIVPYLPSYLLKKLKRLLKKNNVPEISFHTLRHVNASVLAGVLRIPDKYIMDRSGWSTDVTMKRIYLETFSEERVNVDKKVDDYFESALGINVHHE